MPSINPNKLDAQIGSRVAARLGMRGHRADLKESADKARGTDSIAVSITYAHQIGAPTQQEVEAFVAKRHPGFDIDWKQSSHVAGDQRYIVTLVPHIDTIPVSDIKDIPEGFKSIGSALYKRAVKDGTQEIWSLKKDQEGNLALVRCQDEAFTTDKPETLNVQKKQAGIQRNPYVPALRLGDKVMTPDGPGILRQISPVGQLLVAVNGRRKLYEASEVKSSYDPKEEIDFFTKAYGDAEFAKKMVQDFGRKDTRK